MECSELHQMLVNTIESRRSARQQAIARNLTEQIRETLEVFDAAESTDYRRLESNILTFIEAARVAHSWA